MKLLITYALFLSLLCSCSVGPQEIYYGQDACYFCSMTIVDKQHAAQLVTNKGKVYKFDAVECMIDHLSENTTPIEHYLVTDYNQPERLIDAKTATYIISPNIPSPMSANLSALSSLEEGQLLKSVKEGDLFSWDELLIELNKE